MESWLDLHMHSEWSSDGEFKPSILMQIGYGIYPDDVNLQKNDEFVHDQEVENSKKLLRAVHGIGFEFNLVKNAGGTAVLAHPGANMGMNRELTEKLIAFGIDGIEAFSNYHDDATKKFYSAIADEFELITTVGSDFHGSAKPAIKLGKLSSPNPEKTVEKLQAVIKSRGGIFA